MILLLVLSCATPSAQQDVATPPQIQEATNPDRMVLARRPFAGGEAIFLGEKLPKGLSPWFGVRELHFRLGEAPGRPFSPKGRVEDTDWRFDIVSSDGRWLVLLQDHYGPYHVVAAANLGSYLDGGDPDFVLHKQPEAENAGAWVHADARWDEGELVYRAGLTDMMEFRFQLP